MKTSWSNLKAIEDYLHGNLSEQDALVFKARLLVDPVLRVNAAVQKKAYALVQLFARNKMKAELNNLHQQLFRDPEKKAFQQEVWQYFPNQNPH